MNSKLLDVAEILIRAQENDSEYDEYFYWMQERIDLIFYLRDLFNDWDINLDKINKRAL